ncbi:hypothetical protein BJ138DRAFT_610420 [Hygrophoropsis aurantiaca]|uniref:Uncharacterized protein n=1 Tax=Hygrophoropsis aurantiaca TaxID=72124 RepID=A0ACB7ZZP1_9AGAM|nr:hypothetical protein BJ138DRAFT_610420 [Hygrophoropsis aurantiaca]
MSSNNIIVDDDDELITYTGSAESWYHGGNDFEYDNTTHGSMTGGIPTQARFSFNETRIRVHGTIAPNDEIPPISMYTLDDYPTSTYTAATTQATLYRVQFYDSGILEYGQHELVIVPLTNQSTSVWLDYLLYTLSSGLSSPTRRHLFLCYAWPN